MVNTRGNHKQLKPFKKGDDPRRNIKGKEVGTRSLTTLLKEALIKIAEGQSEPYDELLVKRVMKKAIVDGNERMIDLIWKYTDGLPKGTIDLGGSLIINISKEVAEKNEITSSTSDDS